ncbi:MAG: hypothetical protein RR301_08110 [Clostridia bacterium]
MASFRVDGLSDLLDDFSALAAMPDSVAASMLLAEAEVLLLAQRETATTMLAGPYSKSLVPDSLAMGAVKLTGSSKVLHITFKGVVVDAHHKKPTRIAEIAFIAEFGKRGQAARPFIQTANEQSADKAVQAAADKYDEYLRSKNI